MILLIFLASMILWFKGHECLPHLQYSRFPSLPLDLSPVWTSDLHCNSSSPGKTLQTPELVPLSASCPVLRMNLLDQYHNLLSSPAPVSLLQLSVDSLDRHWSWLTCLPLLDAPDGLCHLSPPWPCSWISAPHCSLTFIFVSFSAQSLKQETFFRTERKLRFLCDFEKKNYSSQGFR